MEPKDIVSTQYADAPAFTTKDGSTIRELMHPQSHAVMKQSFAEAIVEPGAITMRHLHRTSEEIYHITQGDGLMFLGSREFQVSVGDTVLIAPGTPHCIRNTGTVPLKILCACTPAYADDDTELI